MKNPQKTPICHTRVTKCVTRCVTTSKPIFYAGLRVSEHTKISQICHTSRVTTKKRGVPYSIWVFLIVQFYQNTCSPMEKTLSLHLFPICIESQIIQKINRYPDGCAREIYDKNVRHLSENKKKRGRDSCNSPEKML